MDKKIFANKLRHLRKTRGFTNQQDLAEAIGVTRSAVNAWERAVYIPGKQYLEKICEVLDCTLEFLQDERGIMPAPPILPFPLFAKASQAETSMLLEDRICLVEDITIHSTLGRRIEHARDFLGLTQAALSAKIGVETQTVSQWENDRRRPDAANLRRICCALDVSSEYLLGLIYKQPPRLPSGIEVGALMGWWSREALNRSDGWSWDIWPRKLEKAFEEKRQKAEELRIGVDVLEVVILACKDANIPYPLPLPLTKLLDKIQMWQKFRGWSDSYDMIESLGYLPGYEGKEEAKFVHHQDWSSLFYRGPKRMGVNEHTNAMLERMAIMMDITLRAFLDDDIPAPEQWKTYP